MLHCFIFARSRDVSRVRLPLRIAAKVRCDLILPSLACQQSGGTAYVSLRSISSSSILHQHQNRYARFRTCLRATLKSSDSSNKDSVQELLTVAKITMEMLSSKKRSFNRTWARMSPLMELVLDASMPNFKEVNTNCQCTAKLNSLADVGCDHGLLSLSLASMAWASSQLYSDEKENNTLSTGFLSRGVTGSDISSNALSGALSSLDKINESLLRRSIQDEGDDITNENVLGSVKIPVDFRVGNGLSTLQMGEADGVILAGMGVHTMIDILTGSNDLNRLQTNYLFLQPTNSRPRHLLMLYNALQKDDCLWELKDETIVYLGGRWYINAYFKRHESRVVATSQYRFPGHFLETKQSNRQRGTYESYVRHHITWLKQNYNNKGSLEKDDERWLQNLCRGGMDVEWKNACDWYGQHDKI